MASEKKPKQVGGTITHAVHDLATQIMKHMSIANAPIIPYTYHDQDGPLLHTSPPRYKTELCRSFQETGSCNYERKCQFAHGQMELRGVQRHPKYKSKMCYTFHVTGMCPYGLRCHFVHASEDEGPAGVAEERLAIEAAPSTGTPARGAAAEPAVQDAQPPAPPRRVMVPFLRPHQIAQRIPYAHPNQHTTDGVQYQQHQQMDPTMQLQQFPYGAMQLMVRAPYVYPQPQQHEFNPFLTAPQQPMPAANYAFLSPPPPPIMPGATYAFIPPQQQQGILPPAGPTYSYIPQQQYQQQYQQRLFQPTPQVVYANYAYIPTHQLLKQELAAAHIHVPESQPPQPVPTGPPLPTLEKVTEPTISPAQPSQSQQPALFGGQQPTAGQAAVADTPQHPECFSNLDSEWKNLQLSEISDHSSQSSTTSANPAL